MALAVETARRVAARVAERHGLPVYLYEDAALRPERRRLEDIRRGGFEALPLRMTQEAWKPDFGPARPHASAGASVIGARPFLIAYNVTLATTDVTVAKSIARAIRESSGGLPALKALGVPLEDRGVVQVSMNLTDYTRTSLVQAFDAIEEQAHRHQVEVLASELIGLTPAGALSRAVAEHIRLADFHDDRILEHRLAAVR